MTATTTIPESAALLETNPVVSTTAPAGSTTGTKKNIGSKLRGNHHHLASSSILPARYIASVAAAAALTITPKVSNNGNLDPVRVSRTSSGSSELETETALNSLNGSTTPPETVTVPIAAAVPGGLVVAAPAKTSKIVIPKPINSYSSVLQRTEHTSSTAAAGTTENDKVEKQEVIVAEVAAKTEADANFIIGQSYVDKLLAISTDVHQVISLRYNTFSAIRADASNVSEAASATPCPEREKGRREKLLSIERADILSDYNRCEKGDLTSQYAHDKLSFKQIVQSLRESTAKLDEAIKKIQSYNEKKMFPSEIPEGPQQKEIENNRYIWIHDMSLLKTKLELKLQYTLERYSQAAREINLLTAYEEGKPKGLVVNPAPAKPLIIERL